MKSTLLSLIFVALVGMTGCSSTETKEGVTFKGTPMDLTGTMVSVGDTSPTVVVVTKDLKEKTLGGNMDKTQVVIIVPSIDTPVCNLESRTFNEKVASMKDVDITIVSMDLPFALGRFCAAEGIENLTMASDYRYRAVGEAFGVSIKAGPLQGILARAVFVIKNGEVVYKELVQEVSKEPNYNAALKAI